MNDDQNIYVIKIPIYKNDLYNISEQNLKDYIETTVTDVKETIKSYHDIINNLPRIKETAKYMLAHKDEYEQLEYANLEINDISQYRVILNGEYSYNCDIEANAKEGWINVVVYNLREKIESNPELLYRCQTPYITKVNGELEVVKTKIYGDVVIFKLDPCTQQPIKKNKEHE